jgi:toxin ParE1/3/4
VSKPVRTEQEALSELTDAYRRYQGKRSGLGDEFVAAIDVALDQITRLPKAGAPVPRVPRDLGVRRAPVAKFPYHVVYIETPAEIRVLAFAHDRRRPGYWLSRTRTP